MADSARPRPEKGTPEYQLWVTAIDIAAEAPLRQGTYVSGAKIPWSLIGELRAALDELGLDWRTVKKRETERRRALGAKLGLDSRDVEPRSQRRRATP